MAGADAGEDAAAMAALGGAAGAFVGAMMGIGLVGTFYGLIEAFTGASPGKMVLGIKIGLAEGTAAPVSTLLIRYAVKNSGTILQLLGSIGLAFLIPVAGLASLVIFVGCFFVLGQNKQALHDLVAKTAVYPKEKLA